MTDSFPDQTLCTLSVPGAPGDGLLTTDGDRMVLWCNPTFARILTLRPEETHGKDVLVLLEKHLLPTLEDTSSTQLIRQALKDGNDLPAHLFRTRTPEGPQRWFAISSKGIISGNGQRLIRIRDVTGELNAHYFNAALEHSPVVAFAQDTDLRYIWSYNQQIGPADADIIGRRDEEVFPKNAGQLTALKRRVLDTGETVRAAVTFTVAGDLRVRDLTLKPLRDAEGATIGITGTALDVTERNQAVEALREKTHELKKRMNELQCLYAIAHLVGTPGIALDELLQAVADTLPSGLQQPGEVAVQISVEGRNYCRGERKEGPWMLMNPIVAHGMQVGDIKIQYTQDKPGAGDGSSPPEEQMLLDSVAKRLGLIIERFQVEAALEESEAKFRGIAQRSFDLIVTSYLDGGMNYVSPAMERVLGYSPEEMIGTEWEDYILPTSLLAWKEGRRKVFRNEQVEKLQIEVRRKNGETAILELNESPIIENTTVVGFQVIGRDISERILYERLRKQAFDMTERNIAQFATLADHIRHPLQVIMGVADLLDDDVFAEKLRKQVQRINAQIHELDKEWMESRKIREFLKRYEL